jgi:TatD DNase family protein
MLVDSHCHISSDDFNSDREDVITRAEQNGVGYMLNVCSDIAEAQKLIDFCEKHSNVFASVGVHPEYADRYENLTVEDILHKLNNPYVVGIGECGLDYHYNEDIKEQQLSVLEKQIAAAQQSGLPLIIHNRESDDDMITVLAAAYKKQKFRGELHCFSSSAKLAEFALSIGFYLSASGIITFKKSGDLRELFKEFPLDRLLVETDSPYLAPTPYRGNRNEPAYVANTASVLAELKNISVDKLAEITTDNFFTLFTKAVRHV